LQKTNPQGWGRQTRFSELRRGRPPGKTSINGHRVQVKQEYLDNSIAAIETLGAQL